jgi:hypothetical protein
LVVQVTNTQIQTPQVILRVVDLRELGMTDSHLEHITTFFLRYFEDTRIRVLSTVFAYCKNSYYCLDTSGHYVHFAVVRFYCGHCYDCDDFQQYFFLGLYNNLLEKREVSESEVESKIIEYYRNHIRMNNIRDPIIIYKILETTRTIWLVKLPC